MPKVSAVTFHYVLRAIAQTARIGEANLLAESGVDPELFKEENAQIDTEKLTRIFHYAIERSGDPQLALHIGEAVPYQSLGLLGYLLVNTDTTAEMLAKFHHYQRLISKRLNFHFADEGERYKLAVTISQNPNLPVPRFHAEVHLCAIVNILRQISGYPLMPSLATFTYEAPGDRSEHERIFGKALQFGADENAVFFDKDDLTTPIATSNASMLHYFEVQAQKILDEMNAASWYAKVKHVILKEIGENEITIEGVSENLGMSVRTLQNRLKEEGKSFRAALNSVRKQLARHYIQNTKMDLAAIALFLGYSEPSAFFRAYKQWTGETPGQLRKTLQNELQ